MFRNISQMMALPECKIVSRNRNGFSAELLVRNGKYKLRIDYTNISSPDVYIVSPQIDMNDSVAIHTFGLKYHKDYGKELPRLCLTYYNEDKWDHSMPLVKTYIPWAIEWTEFYEIWLLTGKWFGKGVHLEGGKIDD